MCQQVFVRLEFKMNLGQVSFIFWFPLLQWLPDAGYRKDAASFWVWAQPMRGVTM